jgi:hypothetical protein
MLRIAMVVPEVVHSVVDNLIGARAAKQRSNREAMHHAGGRMDAAHGVGRIQGLSGIVHIEKAALGIDGAILEEIKERACLIEQPTPMIGARAPVSERRRFNLYVHAVLLGFFSKSRIALPESAVIA